MSEMDETLKNIISGAEGVLGCAVVEISTRKLVGAAQLNSDLSPATLEAVAVSAVEMLRGKAVSAIELLLSEGLSEPINNSIESVCINTADARFFLSVVEEKPDFLVVLSSDMSVSMGMGWLLVRQNTPLFLEQLP